MIHPNITSLYKYRTFNSYSLDCLTENTVWLAKPESFNDPFDCNVEVNEKFSIKRYKRYLKEVGKGIGVPRKLIRRKMEDDIASVNTLTDDAYQELQERIRVSDEISRNMGVFCLTEKPDDILMWSHYADNHRGFCIEYKRSEANYLGAVATDIFKYDSSFQIEAIITKPIIYSEDYPNVRVLDLLTLKTWDPLYSMILTKAKQWEYEKKWRMTGHKGGVRIPSPGEVQSIIFGLRMPQEQRAKLEGILSDRPGILFKEVVKVKNKFALTIRAL